MSITTRPAQPESPAGVAPAPAATAAATAAHVAEREPFWLADVADLVIAFFKPLAVPMLRLALAVVYVWFGVLKLIGASPVADLVAGMLPFLPANVAVIGMGVVEVVLGLALAIGLLVPWVSAVMIGHLLGTFLVFIVQPATAYVGTPLTPTFEGEFIAKNLVLITGLIVVATHHVSRRSKRSVGAR